MSIDAGTSLGTVELTVADLNAQAAFYRDAIGLRELGREGVTVQLGVAADEPALVTLVGRPDAPPRPPRTTGLFHLALLVPSRAELARALNRLSLAGHRLSGASDHLVSEALYLNDPEGNGIEIYCDRPRDEWQRRNGELQMATLPLDLAGVLAEVAVGDTGTGMAPEATIGHVHLQVADLAAAEVFYVGALGFEPTSRGYPGALFVAAGGYHHHLGLNTWAGTGLPAPPPGACGLRRFTIVCPDVAAFEGVRSAVAATGVGIDDDEGDAVVTDPFGNRIVLRTA